MAEEKEETTETNLSPEQRIELLEQKVGKNRVGLMFVALILVVVLSASITAFIMMSFGGGGEDESAEDFTQKFRAHAELLESYDLRIAELNSKLSAMDGRISNNANAVIQAILIEQEQAKQEFMTVTKSAIYDLAHMVPGSRSWLELYTEQLNEAIGKSQARSERLKLLPVSEEPMSKDPFFGDDF